LAYAQPDLRPLLLPLLKEANPLTQITKDMVETWVKAKRPIHPGLWRLIPRSQESANTYQVKVDGVVWELLIFRSPATKSRPPYLSITLTRFHPSGREVYQVFHRKMERNPFKDKTRETARILVEKMFGIRGSSVLLGTRDPEDPYTEDVREEVPGSFLRKFWTDLEAEKKNLALVLSENSGDIESSFSFFLNRSPFLKGLRSEKWQGDLVEKAEEELRSVALNFRALVGR
jgi:hypothetical protein